MFRNCYVAPHTIRKVSRGCDRHTWVDRIIEYTHTTIANNTMISLPYTANLRVLLLLLLLLFPYNS